MDDAYSSQSPVVSGVPQGSVLGPLIFIILLQNIDQCLIYSILKSFADDTRVLSGVNNVSDKSNFQRDLLNIYDWASSNNMKFNGQKFEVLRYGKDEALKTLTNYQSSIGKKLTRKTLLETLE